MADANKKKNILSYIVFAIVLALIVWPTSRIFIQQQLMKVGFFQPKLEEPQQEAETFSSDAARNLTYDKASFIDEQKKVYNTDELKGKVLFINFWATWCPPCRAEMPSIQTLYERFKDNDKVEFLLVEIETDIEGTKKFLNDNKLSLPIVYPNSEIPSNWLSGAIPTTVILDKNGKTVIKKEGMYDYSGKEMTKFIQELIDQQ